METRVCHQMVSSSAKGNLIDLVRLSSKPQMSSCLCFFRDDSTHTVLYPFVYGTAGELSSDLRAHTTSALRTEPSPQVVVTTCLEQETNSGFLTLEVTVVDGHTMLIRARSLP